MSIKKIYFADKIRSFYKNMVVPSLPLDDVEVILAYAHDGSAKYADLFFNRFFSDTRDRVFVFGINPGRFGSGATYIPFTDPVALQSSCGIANDLIKRKEISSEFVYRFIDHYGGPESLYRDFFLTAVSPIGFTRNGVNCNYYDDVRLFQLIKPFIIKTIEEQINCGARRDFAIVLGSGKNHRMFDELNSVHRWFKEVFVLEHPRFIMQYKRKEVEDYIKKYQEIFTRTLM